MAIVIQYLQFLNVKMYFPVKYRLMQPRFKQQERHFRGFAARRELTINRPIHSGVIFREVVRTQ